VERLITLSSFLKFANKKKKRERKEKAKGIYSILDALIEMG
jgi:hypothetical protein